jgi:hypothetical protein
VYELHNSNQAQNEHIFKAIHIAKSDMEKKEEKKILVNACNNKIKIEFLFF